MSENSWLLEGVDPAVREGAAAEAARLGMDLADYLTEVVLRSAAANAGVPPAPFPADAARHGARLEGAVAGLGEAKATLHDVFTEAFAGFDQRLDAIAGLARNAQSTAADIAGAHDALRQTIAADFSELAQDTAEKLAAGLEDSRAASASAAKQAEAALARFHAELGGLRKSLDARITESAEETRRRVAGEFAEINARQASLGERVAHTEQALFAATEHFRAKFADQRAEIYTALGENTAQLRDAHVALAKDFALETAKLRTQLQTTREEFGGGVADVRERQLGLFARVREAESAIAKAASDGEGMREKFERRLEWVAAEARSQAAKAQGAAAPRIDALERRATAQERAAEEDRHTLNAEIMRVEACTVAALEKQAADRAAGDEAAAEAARAEAQALRERIEEIRRALDAETETLRCEQSELREGLAGLADALRDERPHERQLAARLEKLEGGAGRAEIEAALEELRRRVSAAEITPRPDPAMDAAVQELRARIDAHETNAIATADSFAKFERAMAAIQVGLADSAPMRAVESRLQAVEQSQAKALDALRAAFEGLARESESRLSALEREESAAALTGRLGERLAKLEQRDVEAQLADMRQKLEDRVQGMELRNIRALQQVSETVAIIEERMIESEATRSQGAA